jgi:hypothetical protein
MSRVVLTGWVAVIFAIFAVGCSRRPVAEAEVAGTSSAAAVAESLLTDEGMGERLREVVGFGPRASGSEGAKRLREWMIRGLEESGWKVERQGFSSSTPQGEVEFVNVIARFGAGGEGGGGKGSRAIVCTHYDTKKFSTIEFLGANDGGSGTAGLLEFARALAVEPRLASRVDLVFFDGEEAVQQFSESDGLYGSRYFAQQLRQSGEAGRYGFAILWDMIGDKQLGLTLPSDTPVELMRGLEDAAGRVGLSGRVGRFSGPILDDHVPLQHIAGIPSMDMIDFDYLPWHTADDGLEAVSGASVREVALMTLEMLRDRLR